MHQITGSGSSVVSLDSVMIEDPKVSYPVNLDSGGNLLLTVMLPVNSVTLDAGSMVIETADSADKSDTANISFPKRTLKLDRDKGARGTVVKVTGIGFHGWNALTW